MNDNASIKGSIFNLKSKSMEFKSFTPRITDYELLEGIGKQKIWQFMKKPVIKVVWMMFHIYTLQSTNTVKS